MKFVFTREKYIWVACRFSLACLRRRNITKITVGFWIQCFGRKWIKHLPWTSAISLNLRTLRVWWWTTKAACPYIRHQFKCEENPKLFRVLKRRLFTLPLKKWRTNTSADVKWWKYPAHFLPWTLTPLI